MIRVFAGYPSSTDYSLRDFLLFSREALDAAIVSYNQDLWPYQILFLFTSVVILALCVRPIQVSDRIISLLLSVAWATIALVFHLHYFQPINWAAKYFSAAFFLQAGLFLLLGAVMGRLHFCRPSALFHDFALALTALSMFFPWRLLVDDPIEGILLFGWGPTSTAIGTLGLLMLTHQRILKILFLPIPILWCVLAGLIEIGLIRHTS